ncbi:MAG: branched-chain amino acid ABC transporter permease [Actinomycetota bacterium]|nr:branched-chain amino acid ABC transporter permease [Actinomycetota bacterium]
MILWLIVNLVKTPTLFGNIFLIGLTNGAIYGMIALGYTLVYGILQLINFAHGDVFALSGLVASTMLLNVLDIQRADGFLIVAGAILLTLVVSMTLFAAINASIERIAYKPLRRAPRLAALITAVGVSFIVQNVSLAIYGVDFESASDLLSKDPAFTIAGISYDWNKLIVLFIVVPLLIGLTWFVAATRQGKAMRATAQDREAAAMMGIDVNRTISVTFMLAGSLAAAGGLLFLLEFNMRYDTGFELGLIAFTAAVVGGIGNLTGAVFGALLIGFIQAFNEGLTWMTPGSDWTRSIVFGILIAVLVFRPEGLLGERTAEGT